MYIVTNVDHNTLKVYMCIVTNVYYTMTSVPARKQNEYGWRFSSSASSSHIDQYFCLRELWKTTAKEKLHGVQFNKKQA